MRSIRQLIHEVHRRSLWQVLGIYLVASWIGYEVILGLTDGIGLPDWVPGFAVVLFIIGLPIVLATAFIQEGLPGNAPGNDGAATSQAYPVMESVQPITASPLAGSTAARSWLTWRRSLVAGALAFTMLGLTAGSYVATRAAGVGPFASLVAAGKLNEQARILIGDFHSPSGDTALAALVTEAFRIDFVRSTMARTVEPRTVRGVLRRMGRQDTPRLDAELAREIALRDGIDAYVTGEVVPAGRGYVITVRLIATTDEEVLAAVRETARSDDDLIGATDRLSRSLRERTGESMRAIRRTEPLAKVTTSSLAALEKYTQAARAEMYLGDPTRAVELGREALALDSTFAAAHFLLAVHAINGGRREEALVSIEQALRWEDRLTEAQRHLATAVRHSIRRENAQAAAAYERAIAVEPRNFAATNNAGIAYGRISDFDRAAQYYRRAIALDTTRFFAYSNLGETLVILGQLDAAQEAIQRAIQLAPTAAYPVVNLAMVGYSKGDPDATEAELRRLLDDSNSSMAVRGLAGPRYVQLLSVRGRLSEAERALEQMVVAERGMSEAEMEVLRRRVAHEYWVLGQPDRARATFERWRSLVEAMPDPSVELLLGLAEACAWLGDVSCARGNLERSGFDGPLQPWSRREVYRTHAGIAVAQKDYARAIRAVRVTADADCPGCEEESVARIFDMQNQPDSALASYERYLAMSSVGRVFGDMSLGPALRRMGELYEQRGDRARAAAAYSRLLLLWEKADPELQLVVTDARRRLALLQPDR